MSFFDEGFEVIYLFILLRDFGAILSFGWLCRVCDDKKEKCVRIKINLKKNVDKKNLLFFLCVIIRLSSLSLGVCTSGRGFVLTLYVNGMTHDRWVCMYGLTWLCLVWFLSFVDCMVFVCTLCVEEYNNEVNVERNLFCCCGNCCCWQRCCHCCDIAVAVVGADILLLLVVVLLYCCCCWWWWCCYVAVAVTTGRVDSAVAVGGVDDAVANVDGAW